METFSGIPRTFPLLSIKAVADRLAVSRATVYRLVEAGEITPLRVMSSPRFRPEDVEAYLDRHREPGRAP